MEEEDVLSFYGRKDVLFLGKFRRDCRLEGGVLQIGTVDREKLHEVGHAHRVADPVQHVGAGAQFALEHVAGTLLHRTVDFDPDRGALCPLFHDLLDRGHKIGCFVHFDVEVSIPGDPERGCPHHIEAREEQVEVRRNEVFQVYEVHLLVVAVAGRVGIRDTDKPGKEGGRVPLIRAKSSFLSGSRTIMARLSERLEMKGNGWAESKPSGVRTGKTSSIKKVCNAFFCSASSSLYLVDEDACGSKPG